MEWDEVLYDEDEWPEEIELSEDDPPCMSLDVPTMGDAIFTEVGINVSLEVSDAIKAGEFITINDDLYRVSAVLCRTETVDSFIRGQVALRLRIEPVSD
jgi:hypothetical protein